MSNNLGKLIETIEANYEVKHGKTLESKVNETLGFDFYKEPTIDQVATQLAKSYKITRENKNV